MERLRLLDEMTSEELCALMKGAPPGCVIRVYEVEVPAEATAEAAVADEPIDLAHMTDIQRAGVVSASVEDPRLTSSEWSHKLPCTSGAELLRAVAAGSIRDEARGYGRGHAARVIHAAEVIRYLQKRDQGAA